jgi:hypothetical protein
MTCEIKENIDDQVGNQWFIPHGETIVIQLISTKAYVGGGQRRSVASS